MRLLLSPGHLLEDSHHYGWQVPEDCAHKWEEMVEAIQTHIGSLNWGYRTALRKKEVKYLNALAEFVDPHTIRVRHVIRSGCMWECVFTHVQPYIVWENLIILSLSFSPL